MSSILIAAFNTCNGMSSKYDYKLLWFQFNLDFLFIILFRQTTQERPFCNELLHKLRLHLQCCCSLITEHCE